MCGAVFAVIDSATKTGSDHDGTAVVYAALTNPPDQRLVILDWDIVQIEGSLLEVGCRRSSLALKTSRGRPGLAAVRWASVSRTRRAA
jgi:hypothetical protein